MIPTPSAKLVSRWSADGEQLYFDTNITGRFNIWRVPSVGGWPVQITVSDERTLLEDPSPDGRFLLYAQDEGGDEKPNLFLIDLEESNTRNITNTQKVGYRDMEWSPDGKLLAFAAEREGLGAYPIFTFNSATEEIKKIAGNESGECEFLQWSPDGKKLAFTRTRNYQYRGVSVLDLETGVETSVAPIDEKSTSYTLGWTRDSKKVFVTSNSNEYGIDAVALLSVKTGAEFEWLTLGDWESSLADHSTSDDSIVYVRNEAGDHRIYLRDSKNDEMEIPLPLGVLRSSRFSPDGKRLGLLHASADSPATIWVYDMEKRLLRQITHSLVGGLEARNFIRPHLIVYPSFDQTPIASFLYVPANVKADGSHPAIVYPHGGPQWEHMNDWFLHIQYFVSHGFVIIAPNFRGSTGFGCVFMESLRKDCGGGDLHDLVASIEYLKQTGYVDQNRIAVMGGSWGGYLTLMALTKYPELWAAGVAIVPLANWFTAHKNEDPVLQANDEWLMGTPETDRELWHDRSPLFFADRIRAPLLLLAGGNDIRCPPGETAQMAEAVKRNGGVVEVKVYENEGHGFVRRENNIDAWKRAARFLEAHLKKEGAQEPRVRAGAST